MPLTLIDLDEVGRIGSLWDGRASGASISRDAVVDAISACYRSAGRAPPAELVWCTGPAQLAERFAQVDALTAAGANMRAVLCDEARERASEALQSCVDIADRSRIQSRLAMIGTESLRRAIASEIAIGVRRAVMDHHLQRLGWRRWLPWSRRRTGSRDITELSISRYSSSWLAMYQVLGEVCGLAAETSRLGALWRAILSSAWIVPYEKVCWVMALPTAVQVDRNNRLHCANGPALSFADGWKLYAWKGVIVPERIVEGRAAIDGDAIARQPDPVLRRCMLEIMTPERFIRGGEAKCVASDECGRLWRRRWPNGDVWAAVEVMNGTPEPDGSIKHYFLQVPPGVRTAREAVAWTYGLTELRYMALKQRT